MGRLIIVSNRLPVTIKSERGEVAIVRSEGGLATGMRALHEQADSIWIGWPGEVSRFDAGGRARIDQRLAELRTIPVYLTPSEITRFYEGFSNGVLWPLFHYLTDKVQRDAWQNWKTYAQVNRRFAEAVAGHYQPGDMVWVHDYQLALVPGLLRAAIPEARIGFFLHIPFPSSEVFRILPWREELLKGMMGADLIGFHIESYLHHFRGALRNVLKIETEGETVQEVSREIRLGVFPMGIDAAAFNRLAEDPEIVAEAQVIRKRTGARTLLVGVDRLDHTKGLVRRMLGVEQLFERNPALRNKVRLLQIVFPSRTKVDAYAKLRKELDETVGRINAAYSTFNSAPIHYLYRSVTERQLIALYRAADIMLVTPLRDGMNLIAKEFVASRADEDGVLILSEFAGAAEEMVEAIQVNPYDIDRVASAIERALVMPAKERHERMWALRRRVQLNDSYQWADRFIEMLEATCGEAPIERSPHFCSDGRVDGLLQSLREVGRLLLLLDYDGTLVPFASTPDLAAPDAELKTLLANLSARPGTSVHILSGRSRDTLEDWLGELPIALHAEHGYWSRSGPNESWQALCEVPRAWKQSVLPLLQQFVADTPGTLVEEKSAGLAWHYRMADPGVGALQAERLKRLLESELQELPVEILPGAKVIEVRLRGVNKGVVAARLIADGQVRSTPFAMGDDRTDESLFAALADGGLTVHVGPGPSIAQYRLEDWRAARRLLAGILEPAIGSSGPPPRVASGG
jgi:trehalose 6-phosphate synthase/phosphatase